MAGRVRRAGGRGADDDIFRDRVDDGPGRPRLRLLLLRDTDEVPEVGPPARTRRTGVAERYNVASSELRAEGEHPLVPAGQPGRRRSTSPRVYLALLAGHRPLAHRTRSSPLKAGLAEGGL